MDFGFVGGAYEAPNPFQDRQKLVNWYPEVDKNRGAKSVIGLLGCPGTQSVTSLTPKTQVRGAWVLPGGAQALWVSGFDCYLMTVSTAATITSRATFAVQKVGTLATNFGPVTMRDNGTGGYVFLVDGPNGYTYNLATQAFAQVSDPAFYGADRIAFSDGWLVFNKPGTQVFYVSPLYGVGPFNGAYYALKDSQSDNLVSLIDHHREIWLLGERTTEVWYDAGGATFPFARIPGVLLHIGCAAKHSIARAGEELVWLGANERGQNIVVMTQGYQHVVISTHALNHAISGYTVISDAIGYVYQEEGHTFYVLTFPTADATWVYDFSTEMWHERKYYDPLAGQWHRHVGNCYVNFQNQRLIGGYADGTVYRLDRSLYTDNGNPLVAWRRAPHVWDGDARKRVFHSQLQIEFAPGVGLQSGQGSNPQALLSWSDDAGQTWSNEHWTGIGAAGATRNRAIWRRLGHSRDRVYDVKFSDPVNRDVVGAALLAEAE